MTLNPGWLHWPQTQTLIAAFAPHKNAIRFVGGAVRDALLNREVQDVDAATTLLPDETITLLENAHIRVIPTGLAHGTVIAIIDGKAFEITTLRKDVTTDGRHAEVAFTSDWQLDASRRDFTMNALFLSPHGELFDYHDGAGDANAGRVRFIGDAATRISEDYLRILRFFRFHAHYGKGAPDADALAACAAAAEHMRGLSGERIQYEILKLLAAKDCYHALDIMREQQHFPVLFRFDIRDASMFARFDAIEEALVKRINPAVKLAGFFLRADIPADAALDALGDRMKLSNATRKMLQTLLLYYDEITPDMSEAAQKKSIRHRGAELFANLLHAQWAYSSEAITSQHPYAAMLALARSWHPPLFPVSGDDLIERGVKPGKDIGALLHRLETTWEESGYRLKKEALLHNMLL